MELYLWLLYNFYGNITIGYYFCECTVLSNMTDFFLHRLIINITSWIITTTNSEIDEIYLWINLNGCEPKRKSNDHYSIKWIKPSLGEGGGWCSLGEQIW